MPVCPECGVDVAEEGLCVECRRETERQSGTRGRGKKKSNRIQYMLFLIAGGLIVFTATFFLGRSFEKGSTGHSAVPGAGGTPSGGSPYSEAPYEAPYIASTVESAVDVTTPVSSAKTLSTVAGKTGVEEEGREEQKSESTSSAESERESIKPEFTPVFDIGVLPEGPPYEAQESYIQWMLDHTDQEERYLLEKWDRYRWVISWSSSPSLTHRRVIQGFLKTPREYFCREWNLSNAYAHAYLSIGYGQTISGPEIVSRMTNALNPQVNHKVLEIGTGSGYQAAFLAELSNFVYTIEIIEPLAIETDRIYKNLESRYPQYKNIRRKIDDGYFGWEEHAPFDRIIVTCGIDHIPPPLLKQLAKDGIMVIPVGPPSGQTILKVTKRVAADGTVTLDREDIYRGTPTKGDVFVPFTTKDGGVHSKERDKP
jgi:protein-L-isoaspartate(D-aspartate) O-methyltransferase